MIRRSIFLLLLVPVCVRAAAPPLLNDAVRKLIADDDHWAFTQDVQRYDKNGKPAGGLTVERYDPSQPYDQQWQLVEYYGHAPTARELTEWRREKEGQVKHHGDKSLGEVLDLDHAALASETPSTAIFLVPILKNASKRFPADKLEVFMDVDKARRALTSFSLRPREPFRFAGILKLQSAEVDGRLDVVQPNTTPALVWVKGSGTARMLGLFTIGMGAEVNYHDFRRVTPYDDRFAVKIGDVKALNF